MEKKGKLPILPLLHLSYIISMKYTYILYIMKYNVRMPLPSIHLIIVYVQEFARPVLQDGKRSESQKEGNAKQSLNSSTPRTSATLSSSWKMAKGY